MSEKYGIKETKEALIGAIVLGVFVAERLRDGADLDDAKVLGEKLLLDSAFRKKLQDAVDGMDMIDEEVDDLSLQEGIELAGLIPEALKILKAGSTKSDA